MEEVLIVEEGADLLVLGDGGREGAGDGGGGGVDLYDGVDVGDGVGDGTDLESVGLARFRLLRPLVPLPPLLPNDPKPSVRLNDADSVSSFE